MLEVGAIGSPVDVATLAVVLVMLVYDLRPRLEVVGAGLVALARGRDDVDDDRLQAELEVDDRDVEELVRCATDGGDS